MKIPFIAILFLLLFLEAAPLLAGQSAVVLAYHRVGEDDVPSTNIRIEQFEQQLDYIEQNNFTVWPLSKIISTLRNGGELPAKTVAITLDDAYLSIYTEAFPRLQKRGFPFTIFVATDPVDKGYSRYMSWQQLRELKKAGVEIANHSRSHLYMVRRLAGEETPAYLARLKDEIESAQQRLEEELGPQPKLFAYPYGEYSSEIEALVESLGYVAVAQHSGAVDAMSNFSALPRFPINEYYGDINDVAVKLNSVPLPVTSVSIENPMWPVGVIPPRLEVTIADAMEGRKELACYASGQGRMTVEWSEGSMTHFTIQAAKPLGVGRHRYTCTAPNSQRRYQWFSHLWIVNPPPSD